MAWLNLNSLLISSLLADLFEARHRHVDTFSNFLIILAPESDPLILVLSLHFSLDVPVPLLTLHFHLFHLVLKDFLQNLPVKLVRLANLIIDVVHNLRLVVAFVQQLPYKVFLIFRGLQQQLPFLVLKLFICFNFIHVIA